jgi:hypothetical protein
MLKSIPTNIQSGCLKILQVDSICCQRVAHMFILASIEFLLEF